MKVSFYHLLWVGALLLSACSQNRLDVDVSKINVEVKVQRLDQDLFVFTQGSSLPDIPKLEKLYGRYFQLYNHRVISIGSSSSVDYKRYLSFFVKDYTVNTAKKYIEKTFTDLSDLENKLTGAFRHYRYYFPEKPIPQVYTHISGFLQSVVTDSAMIGISLEKYLGPTCEVYGWLGLDPYKRAKMYKEKIASDCVYALGISEFEATNANTLLNLMIYYGKIMYFQEALMPDEADTIRFGFSERQMEWCQKNEQKMWAYLVEKKLLFEVKPLEIRKFVDEAPFTVAFSNRSPGKAAVWIGYQIVKSYMDKHEKVSLKQLMQNTDYQQILILSKYKP